MDLNVISHVCSTATACTFIIQQSPDGAPAILEPCFEKLDLAKLKKDALKYPHAGVPVEKMGFWNHLDEYFQSLKTREEEADPWALLSFKYKKLTQTQCTSHTDIVTIPEYIGNAIRKDTEPIPEVKCHA